MPYPFQQPTAFGGYGLPLTYGPPASSTNSLSPEPSHSQNQHPSAPSVFPPPLRKIYQVQQRITIPDSGFPPEMEFDSCFDTLQKAQSKANNLWKDFYQARYPASPRPMDPDPRAGGVDWYETAVMHDPDKCRVWSKHLQFLDGTTVELWVHEKFVR